MPGLWTTPDWSPDGSKLVFSSFVLDDLVWIANADGSDLQHPDTLGNPQSARSPTTKIAFTRIDPDNDNLDAMI